MLRKVFSLPLLVTALPLAQAMSWLYASPPSQRSQPQDIDDRVAPDEMAAILQGSSSLAAYQSKPDCFRRAAALIQTTCGELETNESERVRAALFMTLCEIATADYHSPPMECAAFQIDLDGYRTYPPGTPGKCVQALSRSAQYWSSYSGYHREVSQLCFAFRRWNDIDAAKELHKNATMEAIAVLRYMAIREEKMRDSWKESDTLVRTMQTVVDEMQASSTTIDVASVATAEKLRLVLSEMATAFKGVVSEISERAALEHTQFLSKLDTSTSVFVARLDAATTSVALTLERLIAEKMDAAYSQVAHQLQKFDLLSEHVESRLVNLQHDVERLQLVITVLVTDVHRVGADTEVYLRNSHMAHEKQLETVRAAEDVSSTLSELVVKAKGGMQDLNGTIAEMKESLQKNVHSEWSTTFWFLFQEGLMQTLKVQPEFLEHPLFRALCASVRVLRTTVIFASSGIMSAFLLLTYVRDLLSRRLRVAATSSDQTSSLMIFKLPHSRPRFPIPDLRRDSDFVRPGLLPSGLISDQPHDATTFRRRTRLSRIPDRLCKSLF